MVSKADLAENTDGVESEPEAPPDPEAELENMLISNLITHPSINFIGENIGQET